MGWTSTCYTRVTHSEFGNEELKKFLEKEFYDVFQFAMVHLHKRPNGENHVCYAIMQNKTTTKPFICVILIEIHKEQIFWKEITEDMGPAESQCPVEFFKFVPCPAEGYAKEWREKCISMNATPNLVKM
mgnify:CR=1 FL=1